MVLAFPCAGFGHDGSFDRRFRRGDWWNFQDSNIKFVLEPLEKPPKPKKIQGNATNPEDQAEKGSAKSKYDPSKDKKKNPRQKRENPKEAIKLAMEAIALFLALGCPFWIPSAKTSPEQMGGVEVGITMYVYGTIWYTDVFRKLHWMQFCYEVTTDASKQHILMRPTNFHDSCDDAETDQEN